MEGLSDSPGRAMPRLGVPDYETLGLMLTLPPQVVMIRLSSRSSLILFKVMELKAIITYLNETFALGHKGLGQSTFLFPHTSVSSSSFLILQLFRTERATDYFTRGYLRIG